LRLLAGGKGHGGVLQPGIGEAGDRYDCHDVARARFLEQRHEAARQQQGAGDIGRDGLTYGQRVMLGHAAGKPLRGVVDENVERAAFVAQRLGEERDGGGIRHVEQVDVRLATGSQADRFRKARQVLPAAASEQDVGALFRQHHRERGSQAPPRPRDDHPLAFERHGCSSLNRCQLPSPRGRRWR